MNIIGFSEVNCFPYPGVQNAQTLARLFGVGVRKKIADDTNLFALYLAEVTSRLRGESGRV